MFNPVPGSRFSAGNGDFDMLRALLLLWGAVALAVGAGAPAAGHSIYETDPNATACCGGEHCGPLPLESVTWDPEKLGWTLIWQGEEVFVPRESALLSPDDGYHGCGSRTRGLFGADGPLPPRAAAELPPWKICFLVPEDAMALAYADDEDRRAFGAVLDGLISTARDLTRRGFDIGGALAGLTPSRNVNPDGGTGGAAAARRTGGAGHLRPPPGIPEPDAGLTTARTSRRPRPACEQKRPGRSRPGLSHSVPARRADHTPRSAQITWCVRPSSS